MLQFIRKSDTLGRIVIPIAIRRSLKIGTNALMGMTFLPDGKIVLKHIPPSCRICGSDQELHYWEEREISLCAACCERMEAKLKGPLKRVSFYAALSDDKE